MSDHKIIRYGLAEDIPEIVVMASKFWANTVYDEDYCPATIKHMAEAAIEQELMVVLEIDHAVVGFACGLKGALLGNSSIATGIELAWWVNEEHRKGSNGVRLLKSLELAAKEAGIKYWNVVFMESSMPEEVEGLYTALGYNKVETTYMKVL